MTDGSVTAPALLAMALLGGCTPSAAASLSSLTIAAYDGGKLVVSNPTAAAITLNGTVIVEGFDGKTWKPLVTDMNLVGSCPIDGIATPVASVTLQAGQALVPPSWRGWSCSGQCETHCRSNIYWGSGPFRFRLTKAAGTSLVSSSFQMPSQPKH